MGWLFLKRYFHKKIIFNCNNFILNKCASDKVISLWGVLAICKIQIVAV